ncbi:MAG TPA: hypothetical protein DCQ64_04890 [Candidatus Rokubacteria bacterium]|nr:hypothetical protein [Candidatus Rokubacteria bacterium]
MSEDMVPVDGGRGSLVLRPLVAPAAIIAAQKQALAYVLEVLEEGVDYGVIPGTGDKASLWQPGAQILCKGFGLWPDYEVIEKEIDHDHVNAIELKRWEDAEKPQVRGGGEDRDAIEALRAQGLGRFHRDDGGQWVWQEAVVEHGTSVGLYRYVIRCTLRSRETGEIVGQGIGSCSTMESKYIRRPGDAENTVVKMSAKRAKIAATVDALALSGRFTQDVEDYAGGGPKAVPADVRNPRAPSNDQRPAPGGRSSGGGRSSQPAAAGDLRPMAAKFDGKCAGCDSPVHAGDNVLYDKGAKKVYHPGCAPGGESERRQEAQPAPASAAAAGFEDDNFDEDSFAADSSPSDRGE